jgi:hypothetical protein
MRPSIALASLIVGFFVGSTGQASAAVYCQYSGYPAGCVARLGVGVSQTSDARTNTSVIDARPSGIVRQDLFDRGNPINLRSDWPSPPAQPGGFGR